MKCQIDFPRKWKWFSTSSARQVLDSGQLMRNRLGLHLSTFGNPIAKESAADCEVRGFQQGEYGPRDNGSGDFQASFSRANYSFCMGFGAHWRANVCGLLAHSGQAGYRLVADTRLFARLSCASFCGVPGVGEKKASSRNQNRPKLAWSCRYSRSAGRPAPGGLRSGAIPLKSLAGDSPRRVGALFWRVAASQRTAIRVTCIAPGNSDSLYHL